jgi:uncharacterized membrane protein
MFGLLLGLIAIGVLGLFLVGAILAIVNTQKLKRLEQSWTELAARVRALEKEAARPREVEPEAAVAPEPEPEIERPVPVGEEVPQRAEVEKPPTAGPALESPWSAPRLDLEALIAGRWLNRIGIVAIMLAAAFFLKYAFDNEWVGPIGRVAIGLVAGTGLMIASQWFLGRGYEYFSEGIAALGGGVLFLSLYAAWDFYKLIPQGAAFTGMVVVTGALAGLALGRNSQRLAVLALGVGLTTPGLLDTGVDRQLTLFSYLAILVGCFLVLAWRKGWRWIAPVALAGVLFYYIGWYESFYSAKKLLRTSLFATLFFAEFTAFVLARARSKSGLGNLEFLLVLANAAWYGIGLHLLLFRDHRWWLTGAVLVLGALHLLAARFVAPPRIETASVTRLIFAGLALTFVTAAIPIRLEAEWITMAWAVEGALLVWAGFRGDIKALRLVGAALLAVVIGLLLMESGPTERLFLNQRFASFAVTAIALAMCTYWARWRQEAIGSDERVLFDGAGVAANVVAVWGLSVEIWQFLGRQQWDLEPRLLRQMGLSLLWAIVASLLILVGVRRSSKALRWQGLVLLFATVVKVFLLDLSFLERAYRITSFLVLGLVLLAVSFWYQKSLAEAGADEAEADEVVE